MKSNFQKFIEQDPFFGISILAGFGLYFKLAGLPLFTLLILIYSSLYLWRFENEIKMTPSMILTIILFIIIVAIK